jgi:hypothetical protein
MNPNANMKNTLLLLGLLSLSSVAAAQTEHSVRLARELKHTVRTKMNFSDAQTDSTMAAEVAFLRAVRPIRLNDELTKDQKKEQINALKTVRNERIQAALHLSRSQYKKLLGMLPDQLVKD